MRCKTISKTSSRNTWPRPTTNTTHADETTGLGPASLKFSTNDSGKHETLQTMTTISNDKFIEAVVSAAHRKVIELSEEHIFSMGQILKS